MKFDLHVHTNHSDGRLSPTEIVNLAIRKGLSGIAITDHDTTTGIDEAINQSKKYDNFKVIPGIELSSIYNNEEVHILGYFINYKSPLIIRVTNDLKTNRIKRGDQIIHKLNELKLQISIEDVKALSGEDFIGRPHIARALINKGYVHNIQEAFDKFLNRGKPGYVERYNMSVRDSINLIKDVKGFAVLAHPGLLKDKKIIDYCISLGIDGIECQHPKHSPKQVELFSNIADQHILFKTAGSDCHGDITNGSLLLGKYFININSISQFKEMV